VAYVRNCRRTCSRPCDAMHPAAPLGFSYRAQAPGGIENPRRLPSTSEIAEQANRAELGLNRRHRAGHGYLIMTDAQDDERASRLLEVACQPPDVKHFARGRFVAVGELLGPSKPDAGCSYIGDDQPLPSDEHCSNIWRAIAHCRFRWHGMTAFATQVGRLGGQIVLGLVLNHS
jgi:hypothetical protein